MEEERRIEDLARSKLRYCSNIVGYYHQWRDISAIRLSSRRNTNTYLRIQVTQVTRVATTHLTLD